MALPADPLVWKVPMACVWLWPTSCEISTSRKTRSLKLRSIGTSTSRANDRAWRTNSFAWFATLELWRAMHHWCLQLWWYEITTKKRKSKSRGCGVPTNASCTGSKDRKMSTEIEIDHRRRWEFHAADLPDQRLESCSQAKGAHHDSFYRRIGNRSVGKK
jgi:hypothetical protein